MNKKVLIIGGVLLAIVAIYMYTKKKGGAAALDAMPAMNPLEEEYYNRISATVTPLPEWVTALIMEEYTVTNDKALAAFNVIGRVAPNPTGSFSYNYGGAGVTKVLWPESQMSALYNLSLEYKRKKAGF